MLTEIPSLLTLVSSNHMLKRVLYIFRDFLLSTFNREFLIFLFFLALSGGFWLLLTLNETYEQDISVPVKLIGVPRDVVITDDLPDTVKVTLRDKGFVMLSYFYGHRLHPLAFHFSNYADDDDNSGEISVSDIQKQIYQQLYGSTKIVNVKSDALSFSYNYGEHKLVPVHIVENVSVNKMYYLANTRFWPEMVTVYGSRSKLDSIKYVNTEDLHVKNLDDTVYRYVRLRHINGVKIIPDRVRVGLYPDVLTEESMEVPIVPVNTPAGKTLRTFPSRVDVKFVVGVSQFRRIHPSDFLVVADYNDLDETPSEKCSIYLRKQPKEVRNAHLSVDQVDYLIEEE